MSPPLWAECNTKAMVNRPGKTSAVIFYSATDEDVRVFDWRRVVVLTDAGASKPRAVVQAKRWFVRGAHFQRQLGSPKMCRLSDKGLKQLCSEAAAAELGQ